MPQAEGSRKLTATTLLLPSEKVPDHGLVKIEVVGENDEGIEVLSYLSKTYFERRDAGEDTAKP